MGRVYKVFDTRINEKIALKLIRRGYRPDTETVERFSNELKFARKIRHKNVCQMFDLGESEGTHYITMEYVSGEDLKSMIRMSGQLGISDGHEPRQAGLPTAWRKRTDWGSFTGTSSRRTS